MAKTFTKLTRPEMRKLSPGGKINEHGIMFEKSATGDGVFTVNIMVDGQRIHRVVGRESDGTTRYYLDNPFFPFSDGPELALAAGATAIAQPGGSKRAQDTIDVVDRANAAMVFTGTRVFRH